MVKVKRGVKVSRGKTTQRSKSLAQKREGEKEFRKYLEKIEREDYPWMAKDLPEKASSLERAKFTICQEFISFKFRNHLTTQQIAKKIHLNKDETQKLLFCWIENFSLDELVNYADKLFSPFQVKLTIQPQRTSKVAHAQTA